MKNVTMLVDKNKTFIANTIEESNKLVDDMINRLRNSGKSKILAAEFFDKDIGMVSEEIAEHFKTQNYLWQTEPNAKGLYLGMWLTENIEYIHLVLASDNFIKSLYE